MIATYRTLCSTIKFPVYKLDIGLLDKVDGLLLLDDRILDDTNMPGSTLGLRRAQTHTALRSLAPLHKSFITPVGVMKLPGRHNFIDSAGVPFTYKRTKSFTIKSFRIKDIELRGHDSLLKVWGTKRSFKLIRPPEPDIFWANIVLVASKPWLVYSLSRDRLADIRKLL